MTKIILMLLAVFIIIQMTSSAEVREEKDTESTTPNILDSIKTGIESTFSEQNIKKAVDNLNEFGEKIKDLGSKVVQNFQNAMKKEGEA